MNISEYLDSYNISEECKQSILELFDRPSLGRTMWDLGGGKNLSAAVRSKLASWKDSLDKPEATTEYNRAHKAHQEAQAKYDRGELSPAEMAVASGDLEKAKARFNKAHGFSGHTVPGAPKSTIGDTTQNTQTAEPTRKEKIRSYMANQREYNKRMGAARSDYNYKQLDYDSARKDDSVSPSDKAILQQKAQRAKSKLLKLRDNMNPIKSKISKARKELFPKSPNVTGRVYKPVRGKIKRFKVSSKVLDESFLELNILFENINTAIGGMMDAQPINLAGKEQPSYCKQKKAGYNYKFRKLRGATKVNEGSIEDEFQRIIGKRNNYIHANQNPKIERDFHDKYHRKGNDNGEGGVYAKLPREPKPKSPVASLRFQKRGTI